jgi:anthranilate phosphoribosyltransferase
VHGSDGSDEITTAGTTFVAELRGGQVKSFEITPEDAGLKRVTPVDLKGGDAERNAAEVRAMLDGQKGPYRDVVLMNAAAALIVAEKAKDLREGVAIAAAAVDAGKAKRVLDSMVAITNRGLLN